MPKEFENREEWTLGGNPDSEYMEYPIIGDTVYTEWIEGRGGAKRVRPFRARAMYERETGMVRAVGTHPGPDGNPGRFVRAAEHSSANATQGTFGKWFLDIWYRWVCVDSSGRLVQAHYA